MKKKSKNTIALIILGILAVVSAVVLYQKNPISYYKKQLLEYEKKDKAYIKAFDSISQVREQDSIRYSKNLEAFQLKIDTLITKLESATQKVKYHESKLNDYHSATNDERFRIFTDHLTSQDSISR